MSIDPQHEIATLRAQVNRLTERVYTLESDVTALQLKGAPGVAPPRPSQPAPMSPPAPITPPPVAPAPRPVARPPMTPPPPPPPPREPRDWGKLAEQVFAARTLAWAGGVATVLGIILLFVMAASRGWITPPMRVGMGVAVSLGLLVAALELDRRRWRSDAILAAAGVGIGGLYTCLWASSWLYHEIGSVVAVPLAAAIAAVAVAVAIRIRREELAIFGMGAAMLAPILVSLGFTGGGVLFGAVMVAASFPLFLRLGWKRLVAVLWAIGFAETAILLVHSMSQTGFGTPVAAAAVMALLFVALVYLIELRPADRAEVSTFGSLVASSAFALSLGGAFLYGGSRLADGHSLAGLALAGVAVAWLIAAFVPFAVRRPHADLTDGLIGFGLTAAAISTALLAGGPGRVCAFGAESVMLVLVSERVRQRSGTRRVRATISAGAYLVLTVGASIGVLLPFDQTVPHIGAGSTAGAIALGAVALAGIVFCFGTRWITVGEKALTWAVPAIALGALPVWTLPAEYAVGAYAAMAAVLAVYRCTRLRVSWLGEVAALVIAAAWWAGGAVVALLVTAPVGDFDGWNSLGAHHGLAGLGGLLASAAVLAWSVRRPVRNLGEEYGLLLPVATLAYLIAEAFSAPDAIWAWLGVAGVLAAAVHVPRLRLRLTAGALLVSSGAMLALGVFSAWAADDSLRAIVQHGTTAGWESIALAAVASFLFAVGFLDPEIRTYVLWVPLLLVGQLAAMLLPGQFPLVAMAAVAMVVSLAAIAWPRFLHDRVHRPAVAAMAVITSGALAFAVLAAYETPRMLFHTTHTPAAGLAAAVAVTAALILAAIAARHTTWRLGQVGLWKILVYVGGAAVLWTLAAAILGGEQLLADASSWSSVHDHFQQGHVLVSITWVLVGLALVVASLRSGSKAVRIGGITLLFVALGKLFGFDLAFLNAMARAVSFIGTGLVLLLAALLLQRFAGGGSSGRRHAEA